MCQRKHLYSRLEPDWQVDFWILSLDHNVYSNCWTLQLFFMLRQIHMIFFKKQYLWFEQVSSYFITNNPYLPLPLQNLVFKIRAWSLPFTGPSHRKSCRLLPPLQKASVFWKGRSAVSACKRTIFHCNAPKLTLEQTTGILNWPQWQSDARFFIATHPKLALKQTTGILNWPQLQCPCAGRGDIFWLLRHIEGLRIFGVCQHFLQ